MNIEDMSDTAIRTVRTHTWVSEVSMAVWEKLTKLQPPKSSEVKDMVSAVTGGVWA